MELNKKMIDFMMPFVSVMAFLKAICIVNRIYCRNKNNYKQIQTIISQLIQAVTEPEIIAFVNRVINYATIYPLEFLDQAMTFNKHLTDYLAIENEHTLTIESPAKQCNNCYKGKQTNNWFTYNAPPLGKDAILYMHDQIEKCRLNIKQCKFCKSFHYLSFSLDTKKKAKKFYKDAHLLKYFQYTTETIFEEKLMKALLADIIFKHTSFRAFTDTYNYLNASKLPFRFLLNAKRLTDSFFCYELCRFHYYSLTYQLISKYILL